MLKNKTILAEATLKAKSKKPKNDPLAHVEFTRQLVPRPIRPSASDLTVYCVSVQSVVSVSSW